MGDRQLAELRRDYFGFIFQRYHLLTHLSALHNVSEMPAIYAGTPQTQRHSRARELLARAWAWQATSAIAPASCLAGSNSG